jgi:hypothetical protein
VAFENDSNPEFAAHGGKPEARLLKRRSLVAVRAADAEVTGFATRVSQR